MKIGFKGSTIFIHINLSNAVLGVSAFGIEFIVIICNSKGALFGENISRKSSIL